VDAAIDDDEYDSNGGKQRFRPKTKKKRPLEDSVEKRAGIDLTLPISLDQIGKGGIMGDILS
jgi:hypothetical protein